MKRKCAAWIPRSAPSYFHSFIGFLAVFLQSDNTLMRTRHGPGWDTTTPRPRSVCNRFKGSGLADGLFLSNSLSLDLVVGIFLAHQCQRSYFPQKIPNSLSNFSATVKRHSSGVRLEFGGGEWVNKKREVSTGRVALRRDRPSRSRQWTR